MKRTLRIQRSDGPVEYSVPTGKYTTILDGLEHIRAHHDKSLLYRHSCHHGSCGTCGVVANGERVLGCLTRLEDLPETVDVSPLTPYPVIGDLAVDPEPLYADFPTAAGILRPSEANSEASPPSEVGDFTRFENCIECGLCESVCPVISSPERKFKGPAALAAYSREIEKEPERGEELLQEIDAPDGVWGCDRALQCSIACPLGVAPAKHIAVLQRKIERRKAPV